MIDRKELMLGNLFLDTKGTLCEVKQISEEADDGAFDIMPVMGGLMFPPVKEIPLTREWMERLGFTTLDSLGRMGCSLDYEWIAEDDGYCLEYTLPIHTVHRMQNFYLALTEVPLTVDEQD